MVWGPVAKESRILALVKSARSSVLSKGLSSETGDLDMFFQIARFERNEHCHTAVFLNS
jgi:hypothetical protein